MNTIATQHPPSAIELLSDVLIHAHDDNQADILNAINSIWLPVFRSEQNLAMALDALNISHESADVRVMCQRYLDAIRGAQ